MCRLLWVCATALLTTGLMAQDEARTVMEWTFAKPGDLQGWQPNADLDKVRVENGALTGYCRARDPFFWSPLFELPARPWQYVEIEMKADRAGGGELFWSNTTKGEYGGFAQSKSRGFSIEAGDAWQTIRVRPYWQAEQKIIHIRLDLFHQQTFAIRAIRIKEPVTTAAPSASRQWSFASGLKPWQLTGAQAAGRGERGTRVTIGDGEAMMVSPNLQVPADDYGFVAVRLKAGRDGRGAVVWVSDKAQGLQEAVFNVRGDGRFHTYNVAVGGGRGWQGHILAIGVRPFRAVGETVEVESVELTDAPTGPADVVLTYLGPEDAVARVGKPLRVAARLLNTGGAAAGGIKVALVVPAGVTVEAAGAPAQLEPDLPASYRFTVRATQPVNGEMVLRWQVPGEPERTQRAPLRIEAGPQVARADYVPVPQPIKTKIKVGTYYFPGWWDASRWEPIERVAPWRKPVLGYYDEAKPEIIDWQVKWAVEHGVSFFLVDWYWMQGGMSLRHWVDSLPKTRYGKMLEWAVMWANHNPPNTHSEADWRKVTQYWIDHYFKQPNYLKIKGMPAVYMWSPHGVRHDLGGPEQAQKLYAISQEMARQAGLPGIAFVATGGGANGGDLNAAKTLKAEGYIGATLYHWWGDAPQKAADWRQFPFSLVAERAPLAWERWQQVLNEAGLFHQPVVDTGWDSRPWHGDAANAITGRTPELFEQLLRAGKAFCERHHLDTVVLGPWNEWGEGSYIEPNLEYGFGMLDAVQRVFGDGGPYPPNLAPVDVGLGPYDLPMPTPTRQDDWDFAKAGSTQGWGGMMGLADTGLNDGALYGRSTSGDPAFSSPGLNLRAKDYGYLTIRMKVSPAPPAGDGLQVFFATATAPVSEANSFRAPLATDEQWHTYVFDLTKNKGWRGLIRQFRLDPTTKADRQIWISAIRLSKEPPR